MMHMTELVCCSQQVPGYPVYRHELDELFLYYNSSEDALVIGPRNSQGMLKVLRKPGAKITSDADYSSDHLFSFSRWRRWNPHRRRYFVNGNLSHARPKCVAENFGYCSTGYLRAVDLHESSAWVYTPQYGARELVDFTKVYFKIVNHVFHNLRPVYEMKGEGVVNKTIVDVDTRRYLFHTNGKWHVGAAVGSVTRTTTDSIYYPGIILELDGNAMRIEYENGSAWRLIDITSFGDTPSNKSAFGRLECSRQLPDDMSCKTPGEVTCANGGTCHTGSDGVSSCTCADGYQGFQCEHRISQCIGPFHAPRRASVMGGPAPHYEGAIMTVICPSGDVRYLLCQSGSWKSSRKMECPGTATTRKPWTPVYNQTSESKDEIGTVATVVIVLACVQLLFPIVCYCCIACCRSPKEQLDDELHADDELKRDRYKHTMSLQRSYSAFFYISWWAWLIFVIVYFVRYGHAPLDGSTVLSAVVIMGMVCLALLYCCMCSESFCSREYNYLSKLEKEEVTAGEQIAEMKAAKPTITFKAECSHNETRSRTVRIFSFSFARFSALKQCAFFLHM